MPKQAGGETNRYKILIEKIFFDHWKKGKVEFEFARDEIKDKATELKIVLPDNVGDIVYSFRYRTELPQSIMDTQPEGREWVIACCILTKGRDSAIPCSCGWRPCRVHLPVQVGNGAHRRLSLPVPMKYIAR